MMIEIPIWSLLVVVALIGLVLMVFFGEEQAGPIAVPSLAGLIGVALIIGSCSMAMGRCLP